MSLNAITNTANDIANYVKRQFGDESGVQISDQDIYRWINSAQIEIVSQVSPLEAKGTTNIVKGQAAYDLAALSIFNIESVHYSGSRIENISFQEAERKIISGDPNVQTGIPAFWYEYAGQINLWPVPDVNLTNGLTIYYSKMPTKIATGTDLLSVPDKFFEAIASWVLSKAYELDEEFDQATNQRTFFQNKIAEQNGEEQQAANATYPTITFVED